MPGWRWIHTPGHTAGHVSLYRDSDRTLLAGDAFVTRIAANGANIVASNSSLALNAATLNSLAISGASQTILVGQS